MSKFGPGQLVRLRKQKLNQREKSLKKNIIKAVKAMPEPKNHYTSQTPLTISYSGNIFPLCNPAQGDTSQTREGDRCTQVHVSLRGTIISNGVPGDYNLMRVIMFYWKVDSAARLPAMADILQASYAASAITPLSPVVVGQSANDLEILSDRTYSMTEYEGSAINFHINKKLNKKIYFNATATTGKNQLYIMFVSDDGAVSYPSMQFISNVTFKDL